MAYEQKEGDIAIFYQDNKKNERQPDWKGRCLIDGEEKELALWYKNQAMMTGKIQTPRPKDGSHIGASTPKTATEIQHAARETPKVEHDDFDDDIPF